MSEPFSILADGRWAGDHGIGRFSKEVLSRLHQATILTQGPKPLSIKNLFWQKRYLQKNKMFSIYFTPGFNPILKSPIPFVITIHDLIHLQYAGLLKKIYYETLIKHSVQKAYKVITVSHYSKQHILEWSGVSESTVQVVANGVSHAFTPQGDRYQPGYNYFLHVGNNKSHKNILRLIEAFANAKIDLHIKLILTCDPTDSIIAMIHRHRLQSRIVFLTRLSEENLASLYRGAIAHIYPSLYEGFGLPPIEAMACGTPVITSNVTSLPEVAGDAAYYIDPVEIDSITTGIEILTEDATLRKELIAKGLQRASRFSWDRAAQQIQQILMRNEA